MGTLVSTSGQTDSYCCGLPAAKGLYLVQKDALLAAQFSEQQVVGRDPGGGMDSESHILARIAKTTDAFIQVADLD